MKAYTSLFLKEISDRINFLINLYNISENKMTLSDNVISDFNIAILKRKGYIMVGEENSYKIAYLTEKGRILAKENINYDNELSISIC
ncbi:hypothetical protein [Clostridium sp. HMP27]|uniref:hypothetical protein n=1 Tax=Clostridium sp. HMP27 TaxID=1487921 RepID=UPI00052E2027|nr:hypothetical protein [Clostridium sp. HMP27]KGK82146.1 hypothetical protein DP68_17620 [Clostridium sp. HMP27]